MGFLRNYVRKQTGHIHPNVARKWTSRLSVAYAVVVWNVFGLTVYYAMYKTVPRTHDNTIDYAKLLGAKNATVMTFKGLQKVGEYELKLTQEEIDDYLKSTKEK